MFDVSQYFFTSEPVLKVLAKTDASRLLSYLTIRKVKKGRLLFREGAFPRSIYIVKSGKVKLFQQASDGRERMVYLYTEGEMFGYRPLLSEERHPASAMALEECSVYSLPVRSFLFVLEQSHQLSNILLKNLSHEFSVLINRIAVFSQKSVKQRVSLSLLIFNERYKKPGGKQTEILLSRRDLASFAGTTIETMARMISLFRESGLIRTKGRKIIVLDYKGLLRLVN